MADHANDPHEKHDFGSFEADGHMIMFKIDYFDQNLSMQRGRSLCHPAGYHNYAGG